MTNFLVPLAVLPIYASMQNVSPGLLEAARDLGSSRLDITRRVVLPLVLPGVLVAFAFCFIASAGDFAIPALLGGVESPFIGNQIQFQIGQTSNWPLAAAMADHADHAGGADHGGRRGRGAAGDPMTAVASAASARPPRAARPARRAPRPQRRPARLPASS